ncbi:hypothetical protein GCM10028812_12650 [Ancylobacter sonchi]
MPGLVAVAPGWAAERCMVWAEGEVGVGAGADQVRAPRLPMLLPPPTRASASGTTAIRLPATIRAAALTRAAVARVGSRNRDVMRMASLGADTGVTT